METNFQKIRALLPQSSLSLDKQDKLLVALLRVNDEELSPIFALLSEDIASAEKLYKNWEAKNNAARANNPYMWEDIMKEEENQLLKEEK